MTLSVRQITNFLSESRQQLPDVAVHQQLVTILIHSEWTVVQGDLNPSIVRAFQRARSYYPADVTVDPGPPASIRIRVSAERSLRRDPALKKEIDLIRRGLPLLWP